MEVKSRKANLFQQAQQATSSEAKITVETSTTAQPSQVVAEKKVPAKSKAAASGEFQISTSATQTQLRNQLDQSTGKASHSRKKPERKSLPNNAANTLQIRDNKLGSAPWAIKHDSWDALKQKHILPKTLLTGSGNDTVNINTGADGRVHVSVNDKEAWSGTQEEFQYLTIDTGDGDDVVNNNVSGANILTGKGMDTVVNRGNNSNINTGEGDDKVFNQNATVFYSWFQKHTSHDLSQANKNTIDTGEGNDEVHNEGSQNIIRTGSGNDLVTTTFGTYNKIDTGEGEDKVEPSDGWAATFNQFYDPDKK